MFPGALPPDSDIYYGFSRFAIELNEIDSEQIHLYPPTDTRFRPDQRFDSVHFKCLNINYCAVKDVIGLEFNAYDSSSSQLIKFAGNRWRDK